MNNRKQICRSCILGAILTCLMFISTIQASQSILIYVSNGQTNPTSMHNLEVSGNGEFVALSQNNPADQVAIFNVPTEIAPLTIVRNFSGFSRVDHFCLSETGHRLAVVDASDEKLHMFSNTSSNPIWTIDYGIYFRGLLMTPDASRVVIFPAPHDVSPLNITILDGANGDVLASRVAVSVKEWTARISNCGVFLAAGFHNGTVIYFNATSLDLLWSESISTETISALQMSDHGETLVSRDRFE